MESVLGTLVKGVLSDYLEGTFDKSKMEEATARIVKSFLMTREGANLPESGVATNFSDNEVAGKTVPEEPEEPQQKEPEDPLKGTPYEGTRVKAIVSMPDVGEDGDSGPVTIRTKA